MQGNTDTGFAKHGSGKISVAGDAICGRLKDLWRNKNL